MEIQTMKARVWVPCSTKDLGKVVKAVCKVGCIGCKMCVKVCPADAVTYENDLVQIDHKACIEYGASCEEICVSKCPRDIFRYYQGREMVARDIDSGLKMAG